MKRFNICFFIVFCFFCFFVESVFAKELPLKKKLSKVLNVYNWEDYFGEDTILEFEKKFGVKVNVDTFKDEDEMFLTIEFAPERYDIIIASDVLITKMINLRLLSEIDFKNIPNFKNIEKRFLNSHYDKEQKFSVPYLWGTTGVVVNTKFVKDYDETWSVLWDKRYKDKIAMLNNVSEVMAAGLKSLFYSLNTFSEREIEEVFKELVEQKKIITNYLDPIKIREMLIAEELWVAQQYSGEGMFAIDKNKNLDYFIPKEGAPLWIDCFAIPRDAEHKYTAEVFMNFILEPEVSSEISNYLWYASCNKSAKKYIDKEILENVDVYPSEEILNKCEFFMDVGSDEDIFRKKRKYNYIWLELNK